MKTFSSLVIVGMLLAFASGCAGTVKRQTQHTENLLLASGFQTVADTMSAQQAHLQTLPREKSPP